MKKIFLSVIILVAFTLNIQAQGFHLGLKLGGNLNKIQGQSFKDGFNLGYQGGAYVEIGFGKTFGLQPEVLFSQTQTTTTNITSSLAPNKDAQFNYLSIPVLLKINLSKLLSLHVGPEYSILMNHSNDLVQNGKDAFNNGNFGLIGGVQLNLGTLKVYGRYNVGLSNINQLQNQEEWKTQQLQIGVGLKLF
jgi:hypothetical protein